MPPEAAVDVQTICESLLQDGKNLRFGGALGVDLIALETAFAFDQYAVRFEVIIPTSWDRYRNHYQMRAQEGAITVEQSGRLIGTLQSVLSANRSSIREMHHHELNQKTYFDRNSELLVGSSRLIAFQVDGSPGTQDMIDKATKLDIPIDLHLYENAGEAR